jgi:hypothetical protein
MRRQCIHSTRRVHSTIYHRSANLRKWHVMPVSDSFVEPCFHTCQYCSCTSTIGGIHKFLLCSGTTRPCNAPWVTRPGEKRCSLMVGQALLPQSVSIEPMHQHSQRSSTSFSGYCNLQARLMKTIIILLLLMFTFLPNMS